MQTLHDAANVVNRRALSETKASSGFSFKIGEYEYPVRGDPRHIQVSVMHAALSGGDTVRSNLGITTANAAEILWNELLWWQTVYFGPRPSKRIAVLVSKAQEELARQVVHGTSTAGADLELYTLIEALKRPGRGVSFRVALPNLKLLTNDGTTEQEYDVVSVVLKGDKDVEVWVWGVTTEANLDAKRTTDLGKIQRLKDLLGGRWETDVRVVTCYTHIDGNDICLEIDGRQERRSITP